MSKIKLSEKYYVTYGGGCRRILQDSRGRVVEHPYNLKDAVECMKRGKHPHQTSRAEIGGDPSTIKSETVLYKDKRPKVVFD